MTEKQDLGARYRLQEVVSEGPGRRVYRAVDSQSGAPVAVKLLSLQGAEHTDSWRQSFTRRAAVFQGLKHPNLPAVLDWGTSADRDPFLVLEWIEGQPLGTVGRLAPPQVLSFMLQTIEGLECLALHNVAHLHLTPEHLLLSPERRVKIVGLGPALLGPESSATPPRSRAEVGFTAPEVRKAKGTDFGLWRADLYSVASITAHLLGAAVTEGGASAPRVKIPLQAEPDLEDAAGLRAVLESCLQWDPAQRPASFSLVRVGFQHALRRTPRGAPSVLETQQFTIPLPQKASQEAASQPEALEPEVAPPEVAPPETSKPLSPASESRSASAPPEEVLPSLPEAPSRRAQPPSGAPQVARGPSPAGESGAPEPEPGSASPPVAPVTSKAELRQEDLPLSQGDGGWSSELAALREMLEDHIPAGVAARPEAGTGPLAADQPATGQRGEVDASPLMPPELPPAPRLEVGLGAAGQGPESDPPPAPSSQPPESVLTIPEEALAPLPPLPAPEPPAPEGSRSPGLGAAQVAARSGAHWTGVLRAMPHRQIFLAAVALLGVMGVAGAGWLVLGWDAEPRLEEEPAASASTASTRPLPPPASPPPEVPDPESDEPAQEPAEAQGEEVSQLVADLQDGLESGDLELLRTQLGSMSQASRTVLRESPQTRQLLAQVERPVLLYRDFSQAMSNGDSGSALKQAFALIDAFPRYTGSLRLRDMAAQALEVEADRLRDDGRFTQARERLQVLEELWPDRHGLAARIDTLKQHRHSRQQIDALLAAASEAQVRQRPHEGIALLDEARLEGERVRRVRAQLLRQLAELDRQPPVVELGDPSSLTFKKGTRATVALHIRDDYQVVGVKFEARAASAPAVEELPARLLKDGSYAVEIDHAFHQDKPVYFWVTATDRSGHAGTLGSPDAPLEIKRKRWFRR